MIFYSIPFKFVFMLPFLIIINKIDETMVGSLVITDANSKQLPFDVYQLRAIVQSTAVEVRSLSYSVQAHDAVLDILVTKTKECPSLVILIPCQKKAWKDWLSPTTFTQDKFMLTFICPVSLCVVECGPHGLGWEVSEPKKWVKKWGPALLVTLKVLHVAMATGRLLGLPIPCLPTADSLGLLGTNADSKLVKDFMSSSWDQIAYRTAEVGLDSASSVLDKSLAASIPSLDSASPHHAMLKFSDEAYKAVHTFVISSGPSKIYLEGRCRGRCMDRMSSGSLLGWLMFGRGRWSSENRQRLLPILSYLFSKCHHLFTISQLILPTQCFPG